MLYAPLLSPLHKLSLHLMEFAKKCAPLAVASLIGTRMCCLHLCCVPQSMEFAKKYALEHGPIIMEMDTYR
jgi:hypothetical protein